ncbi:MAG: gamma-glutamyltransferase [Myxococcota bacterium]|nr:gamma-glutamyltransferase [Myxococcota bacterium]
MAAGHYLAAQIGVQTLAEGGNAADAACAMGFALQVLEPTQNGPGGECPILFHEAASDRVWVISGQGPAPAGATIAAFRELGVEQIPPDGLLAACVPAALDAWCLLLERFGTRRLEDVITPARGLALRGFPMYPFLRGILSFVEPRFREHWPSSAAIYSPVPGDGEPLRNPELAAFFDGLVAAERAAGGTREAGIRAARDGFYRGAPAERIEAFLREPVKDATGERHAGLLCADDLACYEGSVEEALSVDYRGARVFKCPPWSQGPVFLQHLRLLEGFDLAAMGRGSADFLHTWIETAKLAFADRDACYADPRVATVPIDELLSPDYAEKRRALVDPAHASLELRPGLGRLPAGWPRLAQGPETGLPVEPQALAAARGRSDTTQCVAADATGNLVSATPSGGWIPTAPVVPGLGFPIGTRAQMFCLDPKHPNGLAPGKRPRTTLSPSLAHLADGRRLAFGTPGGDQQDQWTSQLFLELVAFGCDDLQEAIEAPTVHSLHMPSSFYPRHAELGVVAVEDRLDSAVQAELARRGHRLRSSGPWGHGRVLAVRSDPAGGPLEAAASPRFQVAWAAVLP